jgi:hypothetical protein
VSIVSSVIVKDREQGGVRFIEEHHTDSLGVVHSWKRFVPVGYDASVDLATHATQIADSLALKEFQLTVGIK